MRVRKFRPESPIEDDPVQISEEKAVRFIRNRLAAIGHSLREDEVLNFLTLLRADGWKLTSREATEDMATAAVEIHTDALRWSKMWEKA